MWKKQTHNQTAVKAITARLPSAWQLSQTDHESAAAAGRKRRYNKSHLKGFDIDEMRSTVTRGRIVKWRCSIDHIIASY